MRNEISTIVEGVANALGYEASEICSLSRVADLVLARHICFYIAHKDESHTLCSIGKAIGNRDHTSVIHGIKKIEGYREIKEPLFIQYMEAINMKAPQIHSILKPIKVLRSNEPCAVTTFEINKYNN
jgi:chromosomal replication initiation ATPase DnaA